VSGPGGGPLGAAATTGHRARPLLAVTGLVALAVIALDQLTKSLAVDRLSDGDIDLFWTLRLNLTFNSGLSFGQGRGLTGYITVLGIFLVAALLWWTRRLTSLPMAVGIALLIGGACGNLTDRLFRSHGGAVIDFIDFQWWPVFNVADIAVSCGAVLLVLATLREPDEAPS
jgi:signal peptidase II